ncbi:MAG TPA: phosphoribosyltransferase family protein, partial [Candidatus Cloacimonas sp.]|nr:phosphoribosyltransferase family protein [Candidatus Cloacimonas sp.]HQO47081.1 phosphoribosyltransferase family protein [Candidatus Cloacimonas sp.]
MQVKSQIMDKDQMERSLQRMAHEIIEQNRGLEKIRLVGIRSRGVPLAERLSSYLKLISNQEVPVGILDITLYRDDLSTISHQPVIKGSAVDFDIEDAVVVLVDDVLYTGRT